MATTDTLHLTKNRLVAVDALRIMTALSVMSFHLTWGHVLDGECFHWGGWLTELLATLPVEVFGSASAVFFVLAGYFACRDITWKKALDNAWWCLAPFVLWNLVCIAAFRAQGVEMPEGSTWYTLMGFNSFLVEGTALLPNLAGSDGVSTPVNGPLWFMRDLVFLFLLSPLLFRAARWLFPLLVALSLLPWTADAFTHDMIHVTMSPFSLAYFTAGCFLRGLSPEFQRKALRFYSPPLVLAYVGVSLYLAFAWNIRPKYLVHSMLGIWMFYQVARWLEEKAPYARELALRFAPVTFLTFATHWFLYPLLPFRDTDFVLLYPYLFFAALALVFFALKRWCRPLLHLVAHYKLRPDDPEPGSAPPDGLAGAK